MRTGKSIAMGAGLAIVCVAAALFLTLSIHSVFPTPLFFGAIVVSTWYGGARAGLFAVVLATVILEYYFVPPVRSFTGKSWEFAYLVQFLAPALITCWFVKKRKDAECSLMEARDVLESRVEERTHELREANDRLKEQIAERIRAEETVEKMQAELAHVSRVTTMGELAASIVHEVNQPLMAVVLNGDACLGWLGRAQPDLREAREAVGRIIAEGNRAGEIIRRIRSLFQKSAVHKEPVDLNELISDILALTQREMIRHGIHCVTELAAGLPRVSGDRVQLQQVVLNLVMNAAEAMQNTTARARELRIRTEYENGGVLVTDIRAGAVRMPAGLATRRPPGHAGRVSRGGTLRDSHLQRNL